MASFIRCANNRQVAEIVKNVIVSQSCGKRYISIQPGSEVSTQVHLINKNHAMIVIEDLKVKVSIGHGQPARVQYLSKIRVKPFDTGSGLV